MFSYTNHFIFNKLLIEINSFKINFYRHKIESTPYKIEIQSEVYEDEVMHAITQPALIVSYNDDRAI